MPSMWQHWLNALLFFYALVVASGFVRWGGKLSSAGFVAHRYTSPLTTTQAMVPQAPMPRTTTAIPNAHEADDQFSLRHGSTVFIEMTDMYGIVYYTNYVTYMQRALERTFGAVARVHCLHHMKYRAAATIGDQTLVAGSLVTCDEASGRSRWRFDITDSVDSSRVFVSAEATLSWTGAGALPPGHSLKLPSTAAKEIEVSREKGSKVATGLLRQPLPAGFSDSPKKLGVVVWTDDLDASGELTARAVINYFERVRTLSLGRGPDGELGLVRLHREGVSIVVTNICDLRVDSTGVEAGDTLEVRLGAKLTRGNRAMTMYETLWTQDGALVAHAEIALLCMDNETRKFRSVPPWVQDILTIPSAATAE